MSDRAERTILTSFRERRLHAGVCGCGLGFGEWGGGELGGWGMDERLRVRRLRVGFWRVGREWDGWG